MLPKWGGRCRPASDEAGLIVSWLVRLLVFIALAGLIVTEVGTVLLARFNAAEAASSAAAEAAFAVRGKEIEGSPEDVAQRIVQAKGCRLVSVMVDPATQTVTVKVAKTAATHIIQFIRPLAKYRLATASHTISYATH